MLKLQEIKVLFGFGMWPSDDSLGRVLVGQWVVHVQFVGHIIVRVVVGSQFTLLVLPAVVLDILIKENGLRGVLVRVHARLIANPVQVRGNLGKGRRIATIAAIDAAERGDAHQDALLGVTPLQHQRPTRVAIAGGSSVPTARTDVRAAKGQRKIALTGAIVDDLELHIAQHIANRMYARGIAAPAGGDAQLVLEVAVLIVPLGQLYGMDAFWKRQRNELPIELAGLATHH